MLGVLLDLDEPLAIALTIIVISLVFGSKLLVAGSILGFTLVSIIASISIVLHELAHKYTAIHLGCFSKYVLHPLGFILTLISAIPFIPIKIIMPGVTLVFSRTLDPDRERRINGLTAFSGPLTNILLATLALATLSFFNPKLGLTRFFFTYMLQLNSWIAFFNLLPIPPLDGSKVLSWKTTLWVVSLAIALIQFITSMAF